MTGESRRVIWLGLGAALVVLGAFTLWPSPEATESLARPIAEAPGSNRGESDARLSADFGEAPAKGTPSSPPDTPSTPATAPSESPSAASHPAGTPTADWVKERYAAAQDQRQTIRDGALQERRKLNVKERAAYWNVESQLIDQIGREAYDRILYDEGRNNRSRVHWVAPGSNAGQAGIESGDVILSYGGEAAFAPRSVREINRLFPPDEEVIVQVDRDGEILEFTIGTDMRDRGRSGIVNGMTLLPFAVRP
ncbi:MAG: PDZ domain-containing protein [Myxococcota bacterium]|nr:PDZ domain-containing protein [Myxococcota bacterium]